MQWSEELSVKISAFDEEHKRLIAIFNNLSDAMSQGKSQNVLSDILTELSNYTKTHFRREEEAMQKYNYPAFPEHKQAHDEFIRRLSEAQAQHAGGNVRLGIPIFNFLTLWVQNHIKQMDRSYSEFFNNAGLK